MLAIYKKELKSYFYSFIGFLFIAVIISLLGIFTSVYNILYGSAYIAGVLNGIVLLFFITIPILTMRILAEEKKQKTDQLILTAPITVKDIVLGKFFALTTIFAIPTLVICIFPIILSNYGTVPLAENYIAILGFFLYGEVCIAIGILISSLTESQVIAAVLSFATLFLGYLMSTIIQLISTTGNALTSFLSTFDLYTPFADLTNGTLNLESIAYFLSIIALMLFLTVQSIQKRRYTVSVKSFSIGAYSTGMIIVAIVITIAFNIVVGVLPLNLRQIDVTSSQIYSLTDTTKEFLNTLEDEIDIYVYVNEIQKDPKLGITLDQYEAYSDKINVTYVDAAANPTFGEQYTSNDLSTNSMIVVSQLRSKVIEYANVYKTTVDYTAGTSTVTGYDGEGLITSAISYVTTEISDKVYFLTGHDEVGFSDNYLNALTKLNIGYKSLELMQLDGVPEDATCVIINAPTSDLSSTDVEKLIAYLQTGGNVVMIHALSSTEKPNIDTLMDYMAIEVVEGIVIETNTSNYSQSQTMIFPILGTSNYTGTLSQTDYLLAPLVRGLKVNTDLDIRYETMYTPILLTSDAAFSRVSSMDVNTTYEMGENDIAGAFAIALETTRMYDDNTQTMVTIGSEYLFTDASDELVSGNNLELFTNIVSRFSSFEVSSSVPVKQYEVSNLVMNQQSKTVITWVVIGIVPLSLLITGFGIWLKRRKR